RSRCWMSALTRSRHIALRACSAALHISSWAAAMLTPCLSRVPRTCPEASEARGSGHLEFVTDLAPPQAGGGQGRDLCRGRPPPRFPAVEITTRPVVMAQLRSIVRRPPEPIVGQPAPGGDCHCV